MAELKTKPTDIDIYEFINSLQESAQKKEDCIILIKLMERITGFSPKLWGTSIIGFGNYHYKSERSRQEGNWFMVGFSPRKAAITLYVKVYGEDVGQEPLIAKLGKIKSGKGCIYIKRVADIDLAILESIISSSVDFFSKKYQ